MTSTAMRLDEDVRELLVELAQDPRSSLFGRAPREVVTSATLDVESLSAGTAGWTPGERHLLDAYREQLANALGDVFHSLAAKDVRSIDFVGVRPGSDEPARAGSLVNSCWFTDIEESLRPTLEAIAGGNEGELALDTLTNVICRLRNDHRSANLHGMALILVGRNAEAAELLRRVYEDSIRPSVRYYAAINLGLALSELGREREALEPTFAAIRISPSVPALCSAMFNTAFTGLNEAAELAAIYLDDVVPAADAEVEEILPAYSNRLWSPSELSAIRSLRDRAGSTSGRILDAALQ